MAHMMYIAAAERTSVDLQTLFMIVSITLAMSIPSLSRVARQARMVGKRLQMSCTAQS